MNEQQVTEALEASLAPRVTPERIASVIVGENYHRLSDVLTICVLTLANGFTVTGESACASPENYRQDLGEHYARKDAESKIWTLEAYLICQRRTDDEALVDSFASVAQFDGGMYVGTKALIAKPLDRASYCKYRGWDLPADENGDDEGMLVQYSDGYISWSPMAQFNAAYRRV